LKPASDEFSVPRILEPRQALRDSRTSHENAESNPPKQTLGPEISKFRNPDSVFRYLALDKAKPRLQAKVAQSIRRIPYDEIDLVVSSLSSRIDLETRCGR
jgi:hypothetical protein